MGHRLIIPEKFQNRTLQTIHEGHFSVEKNQLRAKESAIWPKITRDILQTVLSCKAATSFPGANREKFWGHIRFPQGPWEKMGTDFFEFESTNYLLIADYYTQFPIIRK